MFPSGLDELTDGLRTVVRDLEPEVLSAHHATVAIDRFAELERLAVAGKLLAARRVSDLGAWKTSGKRSAAAWLAAKSGTGLGAAADGLSTAERLDNCPGTDKAFRAGELSAAQAKAVTLGATAAPEAEDDLLDLARRDDLCTLQRESLRLRHRGKDADDKHRHQHARRRAHTFTDMEGMSAVEGRWTPEVGALVWAALDHDTDLEFKRAKEEGRHEDFAAYRADAMALTFTLALRLAGLQPPTPKPAPPGDAENDATGSTETREADEPDETIGPFDTPEAPASPEVSLNPASEPVDTTQQLSWMVERADAAVAAIPAEVDPTVALSGSGRWAAAKVIVRVDQNAYQRTGLEWNYQTCTVLGCSNPRMQIDHRLDYADTHHTKLDELDGLCSYHHALKTFEGWALVKGKGRREIVPPVDPRHPDEAKARKNAKRATDRAHGRSKQTARSG